MIDAILICDSHEYWEICETYPNKEIFVSNYNEYLKLKSKGVNYLYDSDEDLNKCPDDLNYLCMNWYRDQKGLDIFAKSEISFAPAITRRLISTFANDYKNFFAIKALSLKYNFIYLSSKSETSFIRVASAFKYKIKWYEGISNYDKNQTSSPERTLIQKPSKKFQVFSKFAYKIQKIIFPFLKKNILVWDDWTYRDQFKKRSDCLISNFYIPWKGFYFSYSKKYISESMLFYPSEIDKNVFNHKFIESKLKQGNFVWDSDLISLFESSVSKVYSESFEVLRQTYSAFKSLLLNYSPQQIIFPGETFFAYIVAAQLAKILKIETILLIDGYQVIGDETIHYYDSLNADLLFDKYVSFGLANQLLNIDHLNIPNRKSLLAQSPLVSKFSSNSSFKSKKYNAIVMAFLPHQINPNSKWDKRFQISIDVIKLLQKLKINQIALKIKDGDDIDNVRKIYEKLFRLNNLKNNPEIITGEFSKYLLHVDIVVGQISTALYETACAKVNYYAYEPYQNGLTEFSISQSVLVKRKTIARNLKELEALIKARESSVVIEHRDLISGDPISQIKL